MIDSGKERIIAPDGLIINIVEVFDSQNYIKINIKWKVMTILVETGISNFSKILLGKLKWFNAYVSCHL